MPCEELCGERRQGNVERVREEEGRTDRFDSGGSRIVVSDEFPRLRIEDKRNARALIEVSLERRNSSITIRSENLLNQNQRSNSSRGVKGTYTSANHLLVVAITARSSTLTARRDADLFLVEFRGKVVRSVVDVSDGESAAGRRETDCVRRKSTVETSSVTEP